MSSPIKTNLQPGSSAIVHKAPVRDLTAGEIAMLKLIFKSSLDYGRVKIHGERFIPILQDVPMTPFGETYYIPEDYQPDYSSTPLQRHVGHSEIYQKNTFIHEMVHVWQYQHGMSVVARAISVRACSCLEKCKDPYLYSLDKGSDLKDFGVEQQAQIIADYYSLKHLVNMPNIGNAIKANNLDVGKVVSGNTRGAGLDSVIREQGFYHKLISRYEIVLRDFLAYPESYKW